MTARRDYDRRGLASVPRPGILPNVSCRCCRRTGREKVAPDLCIACAPAILLPRVPGAGIPAAALLPAEIAARAILPAPAAARGAP